MKKHAFMIMAHNDHLMLEHLLASLDDERNDIYLHIDKRSKCLNPSIIADKVNKAKLYIYSEVECLWGDFSLVECELFLMEQATKEKHQYYHLLSGADYPLRSLDCFYEFLDQNDGKEFVFFSSREMDKTQQELYLRYHLFSKYIKKYRQKNICDLFRALEKVCVLFQQLLGIKRKQQLGHIYKGSQWFSITHDFACCILRQKEEIKHDFRYTFASDEMLLPTLIMNSEFSNNLYKNSFDNSMEQNLRYIVFDKGIPKVLDASDYDGIINSGCFFGRKFSSENLSLIKILNKGSGGSKLEDKA